MVASGKVQFGEAALCERQLWVVRDVLHEGREAAFRRTLCLDPQSKWTGLCAIGDGKWVK